ncbi:DUF6372 family protein [Streptomyces sp. TR02-1]|uniref:DUF6372 family protein n=1 Tax=Streptomyces sp. TR02-1 TaxID=3385977 RepID=UPI00399F1D88
MEANPFEEPTLLRDTMNHDEHQHAPARVPDPAALLAALVPHLQKAAQVMSEFTRQIQPVIDAYNRDPEAFRAMCKVQDEPSCHCLCAATHGGTGFCVGTAAPGTARTVHSALLGAVTVPMCRDCYEATAAEPALT